MGLVAGAAVDVEMTLGDEMPGKGAGFGEAREPKMFVEPHASAYASPQRKLGSLSKE